MACNNNVFSTQTYHQTAMAFNNVFNTKVPSTEMAFNNNVFSIQMHHFNDVQVDFDGLQQQCLLNTKIPPN
jgi:hypothetical protein